MINTTNIFFIDFKTLLVDIFLRFTGYMLLKNLKAQYNKKRTNTKKGRSRRILEKLGIFSVSHSNIWKNGINELLYFLNRELFHSLFARFYYFYFNMEISFYFLSYKTANNCDNKIYDHGKKQKNYKPNK